MLGLIPLKFFAQSGHIGSFRSIVGDAPRGHRLVGREAGTGREVSHGGEDHDSLGRVPGTAIASATAWIALLLVGATDLEHHESFAAPLRFAQAKLESFTVVAQLPPAVSAALDANGTFPMADPGADWNPFCGRDSSNPEPDRRLIIGAQSPGLVAVYYENGGRLFRTILELFETDNHFRNVRFVV